MNKVIRIALIAAIAVALTFCVVACKKKNNTNGNETAVETVTLDKSEIVTLKGSEITLEATVTPLDATDDSVSWTSSDETVATVDNAGKVNVLGTGKTIITVTTTDGDKTAACMIYAGDCVVDKAYTGTAENYYTTIAEAMTAETVGTIIVLEGDYAEAINSTKSATLIGKGIVVLESYSAEGSGVSTCLENITFSVSSYPSTATVKQTGGSLEMKNCTLMVTSEDEATGGYGILVEDASSVKLQKNKISGYRYGIYVTANNTEIEIMENELKDMDKGIGVDVRNGTENRTAKGEIADNTYETVTTQNEFYYNGEEYDGELEFTDYDEMTQENQNENNDENGGGGNPQAPTDGNDPASSQETTGDNESQLQGEEG